MSDQDRPGELAFTVTPTDHPTSAEDRAALLVNPGFGKVFTDHMALAPWSTDAGGHDAPGVPYGPLHPMPAAAVMH